jgi:hypothetical protein
MSPLTRRFVAEKLTRFIGGFCSYKPHLACTYKLPDVVVIVKVAAAFMRDVQLRAMPLRIDQRRVIDAVPALNI